MTDVTTLSQEELQAWAEETSKLHEPYLMALGRFVTLFSEVEANLQSALWRFAKVPSPVAQAIFSGIRTDGAMQYIRRIADAEQWDAARKTELEYVFSQLGAINKLRNDLLHYGAHMSEPSVWTISNKHFVHVPGKIQEMKITPDTLGEALSDLVKIEFHIIRMAWGSEMPQTVYEAFSDTLNRAWRYKPPLRDRASRKNRAKPRKQPRQTRPSQK